MPYILAPVESGYYTLNQLKEMYIDDVIDIHTFLNFKGDVDRAISDYYESKAKLENG
jgi:hypothetical protein